MYAPKSDQPNSKTQPAPKARSYCRDGLWFIQLAEDMIWGPFDRVIETVMADRQVEERELDARETARVMLQFA